MTKDSYVSILEAIAALDEGRSSKSDGRVTGVNLSLEAGISKATLYRYFLNYPELQEKYDDVRKKGINRSDFLKIVTDDMNSPASASSTLKDAPAQLPLSYDEAVIEILSLRRELSELLDVHKINPTTMANQILLLTHHNAKLQGDVDRLKKQFEDFRNVHPIRPRDTN